MLKYIIVPTQTEGKPTCPFAAAYYLDKQHKKQKSTSKTYTVVKYTYTILTYKFFSLSQLYWISEEISTTFMHSITVMWEIQHNDYYYSSLQGLGLRPDPATHVTVWSL